MTKKVGIAIVGPDRRHYGTGPFLVNLTLHHTHSNLIAVAGRNISDYLISKEVNYFHPRNIEKMFRLKEIDLIIIASPDYTHYDYLKLAIENNKHVLLEKPLLEIGEQYSQSEIDYLFEKANTNQLLISTNCQRAFVPIHIKADKPKEHISIKLEVGIKNTREPYLSLYKLLISHPISILIKTGLKHPHHFSDIKHSFPSPGEIVLQFRYEDISGNIHLLQSEAIKMAKMELSIDHCITKVYPVHNDGKVITMYENDNFTTFSDDLLKISFDMMIDAVLRKRSHPLIRNEESLNIHKTEQLFFHYFKQSFNV